MATIKPEVHVGWVMMTAVASVMATVAALGRF